MAKKIWGGRPRNWAVLFGSDHNNSDAGLTLFYGPQPSDGVRDAWRHVWRINIRWPVSLRHRHIRPLRRNWTA